MKIRGLEEILEAFKKGWAVIIERDGVKGPHRMKVYSRQQLLDLLSRRIITFEDLICELEVENYREFHLYFDSKMVPSFDDGFTSGVKTLGVSSTLKAIYGDEFWTNLPHEIHTTMINLCELKLLSIGFRIFIHPQKGYGDVFEITLGSCDNIDREIKPAHNLPHLLLSGAFGDLFEDCEKDFMMGI